MQTNSNALVCRAVLCLTAGLLLSPWTVAYGQQKAMYVAAFDPYLVGAKQQDLVLVENGAMMQVHVVVTAYDPLSGEMPCRVRRP